MKGKKKEKKDFWAMIGRQLVVEAGGGSGGDAARKGRYYYDLSRRSATISMAQVITKRKGACHTNFT